MDIRFSDGVSTYPFSSNYITPLAYTPTVGDSKADRVKDQIEVLIKTASLIAQQAVKDAINGWLALARAQQEIASETRIYIEIKQNGESEWRRSELLDGRLQPARGALDGHSALAQEYIIHVERRNWWEWPEVQLPLSIDNAIWSGMDVLITNGSSSPPDIRHTLFFAGSDIEGDPNTPIPVRLELTPNAPNHTYVEEIFVAHNYFSSLDPLADDHILEGEADVLAYTVSTTDATARGGYMSRYSFLGPLFNVPFAAWQLSSARLAKLAGRWYRLLVRLKVTSNGTGGNVFGRISLYSIHSIDYTDTPLTQLEEVQLFVSTTYNIIDFGAIQLPTFVANSPDALQMVLTIRAQGGGAAIDIDFLQLSPVDSFHHAINLHTGDWEVGKLIIDGQLGRTYALAYGTGLVVDGFATISPQPMLWPGRNQWMTILYKNGAQSSDIYTYLFARAFYRPRRLTV